MPTSHFTDFSRNSLYYLFFRGLNFLFDTISLYSFKAKVLRVLFQLESPNSEHRNSRYVRNNPDYSMFKLKPEFGLHMAPIQVNFWATYSHNLTMSILYGWFSLKSILIGHLNHPNRIRNEQVMAKIQKTGRNWEQSITCTGTPLTCTGTCWPKMTRSQNVPVHVQVVPVHVTEYCPKCVFSPIFHALSSIDHSYYILHQKLTWNPSQQLHKHF